MITLKIDGKEIKTEKGKTILEAARENGIYIPTLCYHENLLPIGSCRLCIVEIEGYEKPMASCTTAAVEGISVTTQSEKLFAMRQEYLRFLLINHPSTAPSVTLAGNVVCRTSSSSTGSNPLTLPPGGSRKRRNLTPRR
jgi:NADH dehydrogenase/NADH:ubiquinone oxidoreductase subunit G